MCCRVFSLYCCYPFSSCGSLLFSAHWMFLFFLLLLKTQITNGDKIHFVYSQERFCLHFSLYTLLCNCFFWAVIVHYWNTVQDLHLKQCSYCDSKLVWALFPQKTVLQILRGQKSRTVSGWFYMPKGSLLTLLRVYSGCGVLTSDCRMRSNYGGISILQRAKTNQPWFIF